jgi:hypothetical protein
MTDTSKPESVKLDEYKKSFDKERKKYPSKMKKRKRFLREDMPKNVLEKYPKVELGNGKILVIDPNSNISLSEGPEFKAKGGRAGYKSGGRGCKLAMKGKGRAYGKNS